MSKQKILISGCGISWSGQEGRKTWGNILKVAGADVVDVGGPAVSNQWILNRAIDYVLKNLVDAVVIQLTSLGKLDVEVDHNRELTLVQPDTIRNFVIDGVWPSSASLEHPSKKLWYDYLYSPGLELQDIKVKLELLKFYCDRNKIQLLVLKGYDLPNCTFDNLISNNVSIYEQYLADPMYVYHNEAKQRSVPCIEFQFNIAYQIVNALGINVLPRLDIIQVQYWQKNNLQSQTKLL